MSATPLRSHLVGLVLALPLMACSGADTGSPKNVLLISIDTLRPDHLGCYGAKGDPTPNIDRLAARGVRFEWAYSAVPVTTPSHATLFTGTFPPFHGVRSNGSFALSEHGTTIAEMLHKEGYATGGFVGAFPLDRQFGFAQGFDSYDDQIALGKTSMSHYDAERPAASVVDHALEWYGQRDPTRPFFLFVHFYDPHAPYSPPDAWKAKFPDDPYTGEIAYVDEQIGRIFTRLDHDGRLDDTLVMLVSDHGESLGEHGEATHMVFVYDATLRVPMILAGPGVPAGRVSTEPAQLVDVLPTLAAATGTALPPEVQGADLAPAWTAKGRLDPQRYFYAESMLPQVQFGWAPLQSIRMGRWKYILAPEQELYDLEADPKETNNLFRVGADGKAYFDDEAQDSAWREARHRLAEAVENLAAPDAGKALHKLDAEAVRKLQSLGYLGSAKASHPIANEALTLPDPKRRIDLFNAIEKAGQLGDTGQTAEAIAAYTGIIAKFPDESWIRMSLARNLMTAKQYPEVLSILSLSVVATLSRESRTSARGMRAGAFEELGRWEDALAEWEVLTALAEGRVTPAEKGKGNVLVGLRRYSEAIPPLERFTAANGADREAHLLLGAAYLGAGRQAEGMAQLARARDLETAAAAGLPGVAVTAGDPNAARLEASRAKRESGDFAGAAADLEAVAAGGGESAPLRYELFVYYLNLGRNQEAREALARCLELDPDYVPALADLGLSLERRGRKEEAEIQYRRALSLDRDFYPALARLGILLARAGIIPESISLLERAVKVNPGSAEAHLNLAMALKQAGRLAEAEKQSAMAQGLAGKKANGNGPEL